MTYEQGELWLVKLDPTEGSEIRKTRPCLIISRTIINDHMRTVTVIPLSGIKKHKSVLIVPISANETNGLSKDSNIIIPQIRTISKSRFKKKLGQIDPGLFENIKESFQTYFWDGVG
ncbi:MAG: type II toxin-antitoxin system PemK/MazF family toxin [bacterium]|nr:type II toxin-antitoxin system PemK/MazF family toxin [bacterium]